MNTFVIGQNKLPSVTSEGIFSSTNTPGTAARSRNDNVGHLALWSCRGYTTAQINTPCDYIPSLLKIVSFGSDDGVRYGATQFLSIWTFPVWILIVPGFT